MLKGEGGNYDDEQYLDVIVRNAKRLRSLSESILDVTRIESRTLKLNKEKFNINEKIRNVIDDIKSKEEHEQEKLKIIFDNQEMDPIIVEADTLRIYQVISNLLINALKSSKKRIDTGKDYDIDNDTDSTIITVLSAIKKFDNIEEKNAISAAGSGSDSSILSNHHNHNNHLNHHNDKVIISIKDRGTGIDPDVKDKLFSKFVTKSDAGGSGLGLYISKGIVEAHGGKIWAENNIDGMGATFSFSLPIPWIEIHLHLLLTSNQLDSDVQTSQIISNTFVINPALHLFF